VVAPRVAELDQAASPRAAIRQLFLSIPTRATRRRERRGCLLCNAAVERAPVDAKVQAEVMSGLGRLGTALRRALLRACAAGEIAPSIDPAALADYLLSSYVGLIVIAKAGRKPAQLRRTAELVLKALAPG
jgi:TetR/AcrR family transcriptional repressor of nem operon